MFVVGLVGFVPAIAVFVLLWSVAPLAALAMAVKRARTREFRAAVPWLLVPVFAVFIVTAAVAFDPLVRYVGDVVMFRIHKSAYDRIVREVSSGHCTDADRASWLKIADVYLVSCQPVIVVIGWGAFLSSWYGVVYDGSDEIAKPPERRSQQWSATETGQALAYTDAWKPLDGHYYLASGDL